MTLDGNSFISNLNPVVGKDLFNEITFYKLNAHHCLGLVLLGNSSEIRNFLLGSHEKLQSLSYLEKIC